MYTPTRLLTNRKYSLPVNSAIIFLIAVFVTGCASMGGIYPEDKGDICANQRGDLRRTEDYFLKAGVTNVVGGALIGAASGAIISAISGGNVGQSAMIGAAAGAGAGLVKTLYDNLTQENQKIDMANNAFNSLSQCRFSAADQVRADFSAARISKPDAMNKLSDLKIRYNQDISIANRIGAKISQRSQEFQNNLVKEDPSVAPYLTSVNAEQQSINNQTQSDSVASPMTQDESALPSKHRKYSKKATRRHEIGQSVSHPNTIASANKQVARNQIQSGESVQAADATATNIIKAKSYQDSVKSVSQKANFGIEGQIGMLLLPTEPHFLTLGLGLNNLCPAEL